MKKTGTLHVFYSSLDTLPKNLTKKIIRHIDNVINYEPIIGIMGKTGAGKSSLCNAIFSQPLSPTSNVHACTRKAKSFRLSIGSRQMTIIDLPGVGESSDRDKEYQDLYEQWLPKLDLIIWVIKADDRALSVDQHFYQNIICAVPEYQDKVIFVLNQVDKIEPCREWDSIQNCPSSEQKETLELKIRAVEDAMGYPRHAIKAISAVYGYNLPAMIEDIIYALPRRATSCFTTQIRPTFKSETIEKKARQDFSETMGNAFDRAVEQITLPTLVIKAVKAARDVIVSMASSLWSFFF
ncbi:MULTISPECIES: GTPase family protein [Yersinia]|uniref:GTPase family protein n=1 Tax=Yersinia TaxID=629 RepID=UPI0005DC250A|nr:GTPase [Yersinia kristensenii]EKN5070569.1 GTP-binding protein [Yersinia enterocolitica]CNG99922.1 GTPase [Yersinia kristensenii]CNK01943.1 GTPase [Yersinia kristensenii]HDL6696206.1 50S ribosome-binding GTPase [Yersinia enterocolitica]HEI6939020.1 50S ribosome-binding GTPase [Yersinia enterocolitica]